MKKKKANRIPDSEIWNLDYTIAHFVRPRLIEFAKDIHSYPPTLTAKKWEAIIQKMIKAFEYLDDGVTCSMTDPPKFVKDGLNLFAKYFVYLWN